MNKVNKLMRVKFVDSIFVFVFNFRYLTRSLSVISQFLKIDNSIVSKWYQTFDDKSVQCLQP